MSTLLVVDDIEGIHEMLDIVFENTGVTLLHAMLGQQALDIYRKHEVDVVLSDIQMPGMDGLDLLQELKAVDPAVTVVLTTAVESRDYVIKALRLGAYDYVEKPYEEQELRAIVQRALKERERRLADLNGTPAASAAAAEEDRGEKDRVISELKKELEARSRDAAELESKRAELERVKLEMEVKEGALQTMESVLKERMENLKAARVMQKQDGGGLSPEAESRLAEIQAKLEAREAELQELEAGLQERELFISQTEESLMDKGMRLQEIETELDQMREDIAKRGGGGAGGADPEAMAEVEALKVKLAEREAVLAEMEERVREKERAVRKAEALVKAREHFLAQSETILFGDEK